MKKIIQIVELAVCIAFLISIIINPYSVFITLPLMIIVFALLWLCKKWTR